MPRTELVWDGKYDGHGKRVAPFKAPLPFQTVETVNESTPERRSLLSFVDRDKPWRNRLIWGDKKYVLPSLLPEFAGKVNLIYIDPPFDTGADFSFNATIHDGPEDGDEDGSSFTKQPSIIEQKAYRDTWGKGIDSYLQWFYETVSILHELLAPNGSIFVHLDWHVCHYAKVIMDEVFGENTFQNEIIWQRTDPHNDAKTRFGNVHDVIYWFGKNSKPNYYPQGVRTELSESALAEFSLLQLSDGTVVNWKGNETTPGRRFKVDDATWKGKTRKFTWRGAVPSANREWMYDLEGMEAALERGELYLRNPNVGAARCSKSFLDENRGIYLQDIWQDVGRMKGGSEYRTQKPEALLERIVKAASDEGELVLDCFCGSGTTAVVAEKLGRNWITCDLGRFAVHTARKRLLGIPGVRPFAVQNLGKYERQHWQTGQFAVDGPETSEQVEARHRAYTKFILELYHAEPVAGYSWLHGKKGERFVHVGGVDGPVTDGDVKKIALEFKKSMGTGANAPKTNGIDVLGWDFAFEINEITKQQAESANVQLRFKKIPRDVMDKRAAAQGDIHFFEMAALAVKPKVTKRKLELELTDFIIPPDDVPEEVRAKVKHWSQWIDFWAVDWDYQGDAFHNEWQAFRTKKETKIPLSTSHTYPDAGDFKVMVKVIDILGNDTTKTLTVKVK